eukprot:Skav208443  [mRNA]  locus=scaffold1952:191232:191882:- [translate_table: standard]
MARIASVAVAAALTAGGTMTFVGPAMTEQKVSQKRVALRASAPEAENLENQNPLRVGGAMLSIVAALALVVMPVEAQAAKSGGRIGGTASAARSKPPPRPAAKAPAASSTNKTTVINQTTVIAPPPPVVAAPPMGMGMCVGMAPVVVAPAPSLGDVVVGSVIGGAINNAITGGNRGPTNTDRMLENQQRQDERQIDSQKAELEMLKSEIQSLKAAK